MKLANTAWILALGAALMAAGCGDDDDGDVQDGAAGGSGGAGGRDGGGVGGTGGSGGTGGARDGGADTAQGGSPGDGGTPDGGTAMARGANNPPTLGAQIDRMGRPAISTALVETFNANETAKNTAKDAYNAALPATWNTFVQPFRTSLAVLDALDGNCGNQLVADGMMLPRYTFLATVLADDQLYVNSGSGKCGIYLGLEAELVVPSLPAELKGSCGGRTPNDDVIERSYSVLAAGALTGVDDTIKADDATHSTTAFPWLAAPK